MSYMHDPLDVLLSAQELCMSPEDGCECVDETGEERERRQQFIKMAQQTLRRVEWVRKNNYFN